MLGTVEQGFDCDRQRHRGAQYLGTSFIALWQNLPSAPLW